MSQHTSDEAVCRLRGIQRAYGGVKALAGVDLTVYSGRVNAIVGENGAGKSTLMKILAGAERADAGTIILHGRKVEFENVAAARAAGISIVFQELSLFPDLDVLANLGALSVPTRLGFVRRRRIEQFVRPVMRDLGLEVGLNVPLASLELHERQLVEIARALLSRASILVLDEPNSALNAAESERLFDIVGRLAARGTAILYVSHRLEEVFRIAQTITVLRNGKEVLTTERAATSIPKVVAAMIGRESAGQVRRMKGSLDTGRYLNLSGIQVGGLVKDVSFRANAGEIVGLAGLEGAGQRTVFDVIFGRTRLESGTLTLPDGGESPRSIRQAVRSGIALVPSDRRVDGLMLEQSIAENVAEVAVGAIAQASVVVTRGALDRRAVNWMSRLSIRAGGPRVPVAWLSGGNQQKTVLAKWLAIQPVVILLDDPTRGVDVGAKEEIYAIVRSLATHGCVTLFYSTELSEYLAVCDRVVVFFRGSTVGDYESSELTEHRLLEAINTGRVAGDVGVHA